MLRIKVNGQFLELPPNTVMDIERQSPVLQFNEEVTGGYSLPITLKNSDVNTVALEYSGRLQKRVTKTGFDTVILNDDTLALSGKLKIEKTSHVLNKDSKTGISAYLLTDVASFYQDIKDKKLRQIDAGGNRTFAGGTSPVYASAFGIHILNVAKGIGGPYDYAIYPVMNTAWGDDPGIMGNDGDVMNKVYQTESGMTIGPIIVPFPYLKYILLQAVAYAGWTIEGDILTDADFERITMINFKAIDWGKFRQGGGSVYYMDIYDDVSFNLQDHLPDITLAEFFIALKNRFGWIYDFRTSEKKIIIRSLSQIVTSSPVDLTSIASPLPEKTVIQEGKIFSLKNNFVAGGSGDGIDITKTDYQGTVHGIANLPAAGVTYNNQVYLVQQENNYYICLQDPDNSAVWRWEILAANIYDYIPAGATEEIITMATTVEMVKYSDYMDFIPRIDSPGIWSGINGETPWGIHLCFWIGFGDRKLGASGGFSYKYPQASHHIYTTLGSQFAQWSLAFKGEKTDGTQVGLYDLNWKAFLDLFAATEEIREVIYPSLVTYLGLRFDQVYAVDGVKLIIKSMKHTIPFKNRVELLCWRI